MMRGDEGPAPIEKMKDPSTMAQTPTETAAAMSSSQERELQRLCQRKGERVERRLTEQQAQCRIDTLRLLHTLPSS